jgi:eukaryotic-like serine/threonine-protein kinase
MARSDFEIVDNKPIGRGYSGTVFRARRLSDGTTVALKLVLRNEEGGAERIAAERHGAILQQRFAERHRMVPEVYDHGADGDDFYIAMEFIDGPSLELLLRRGSLTPQEAVGHAIWICDFLEKAHGFSSTVEGKPYRLLHNDLKPAHLMISASGDRRVLDFGISKALEETKDLGTDVGRTIAYAAPERLLSGRVNAHADFWSLGVMLYEMVSGHRPYPTLDGRRFRAQLEHAIVTHAPRTPLPPGCSGHLAAIINRLLAFQPEHRYQTPAAIREDLERFLREETPLAATYYDTPATTPVVRPPTPVTAPVIAPNVAPTDPIPAAANAPVNVIDSPAAPGATRPAARRSLLVRSWWTFVAIAFAGIVATEGVACTVAERFRDGIHAIDERTVISSRAAYAAVDRWSILDVGLRMRVHGSLAPALRAVGDRVIADYRRDAPSMGPAEWRQAQEAFAWARELSPGDRRLRAKELIADAHVQRFEAQKARTFSAATLAAQAALVRFRQAATMDAESFDPYLGMAVVQVYALADVDAAAASIEEAVKRGYATTRRETALLGDGHMRRGVSTRERAALLSGERRRSELLKAKTDFERCVALFDQIVEFGRAAQHLEICKKQLERIERHLEDDES